MSDFEFLKGNIRTIILNALFNGDKYGYEIAKEIKEKTENKYEIKQPTLYAYLKRLEDEELISSYWGGGDSNGGRRRYYRLTEGGKKICIDYMSEWNFQRSVIDSLVATAPTEDLKEVTQEQATPLFGSKTKQVKRRTGISTQELSEINKKLENLNNGDGDIETSEQKTKTPSINEQLKQTPPAKPQQIFAPIDLTSKDTTHPQTTVSEKAVTEQPTQQILPPQTTSEKLEPSQEEKTQEKQYKQILENLLGGQFEKIDKESTKQTKDNLDKALNKQVQPSIDSNSPIYETVKKLSAEGIQIKLFESSKPYSPISMIFINKLNCLSAWVIALLLSFEMTIFYFAFKKYIESGFAVFAVLIALFLVPAIWLLIKHIKAPTKKIKSHFNFKFNFINSLIFVALAIVIDCIVYFVIITPGETPQLLMNFILPLLLCANVPLGVWIYSIFNKVMSK